MFTSLDVFQSAQSMARHAAKQQAVVAQNIAHANTPGFKAMTLSAPEPAGLQMRQRTSMQPGRAAHFAVTQSASSPQIIDDKAAHLSPNGNSVSIEAETLKSIEAERQHKRAMTVYRSAMTVLRTSIGR